MASNHIGVRKMIDLLLFGLALTDTNELEGWKQSSQLAFNLKGSGLVTRSVTKIRIVAWLVKRRLESEYVKDKDSSEREIHQYEFNGGNLLLNKGRRFVETNQIENEKLRTCITTVIDETD
ncbi:hypothetical protein DICVIV_08603 [Dictyocaulus viviparus]|uniref:Uncharacterized protein n=1 Tax=Dictyocaulus viviparus TaxID=29172 RepID=A0A0D8XNP2_DICVI|nr:hypothetical protein DICVIV_08603 [Dictyocaulus viviparus]